MSITPQRPIGSDFNAESDALDVVSGIDLTGKNAVVTGGASGLGVETVRALASAGARVVVPARDVDRGQAALADIDNVSVWEMDLTSPRSIKTFAHRYVDTDRPLHMLVNSAGIMGAPLARDSRGFEMHLATNHLGHFQLASQLWPALRSAKGARVVSVSSWGHRYASVDFDDPNFERREYQPYLGYGQSKTANVLFAVEMDRRGQDVGVRAFSLHPGSAYTPLAKHISADDLKTMGVLDSEGNAVVDPTKNLKSVEQGAATSVWAATSPQLDGMGGVYCENCDIAPLVETEVEAEADAESRARTIAAKPAGEANGVLPEAVDADTAAKLWALSETLLGLTFR